MCYVILCHLLLYVLQFANQYLLSYIIPSGMSLYTRDTGMIRDIDDSVDLTLDLNIVYLHHLSPSSRELLSCVEFSGSMLIVSPALQPKKAMALS